MRVKLVAGVTMMLFLATVQASSGEDRATKKEAEAMVKKAVALYKKEGTNAFQKFNAPNKTFVDKDFYVVAYDTTGKCVAHGQNPKQVGKDLIGMKDPDGKAFVKERVELAKSKGKFWQDYKFTDPLTKKLFVECHDIVDTF